MSTGTRTVSTSASKSSSKTTALSPNMAKTDGLLTGPLLAKNAAKSANKSPLLGDNGDRTKMLLLAAAISVVLSLVPYGNYVLYPFKLFTTWVHECGHATMAILVGGSVHSVTIETDTSGLTQSMLPYSSFRQALVTSAGYMGASIFGCVLLAATRLQKFAHTLVFAIGALMLTSLVFWIRNGFGVAVVIGLGVLFVLLGRFGKGATSRFVMSFLAIQVALNALFDIRVLFQLSSHSHSDALSMSKLFWLPAWFWASLWMVSSIAMFAMTLFVSRGNRSASSAANLTKKPTLALAKNRR